jgi:hypothetical protein
MDKVKFYENLNELNTMDLINLNEKLEVFMIKSPIPVPLDRACICIFIKIIFMINIHPRLASFCMINLSAVWIFSVHV